ncbi:MAG: tRNA 2-thiouridine(34) synthase MnmA [Oscillospiraceae bacterium]|nr:tRNA 2-thiouridine(34) synthase MnmA [Oscillospiraceae bacterium]
MKRVIVGMSGGVDSAVTAYLLKIAGYDVIGVTLRTWQSADGKESRCCEITDARNIADQLDIPYYALNCLTEFREQITAPFVEAYLSGKTPNPCILCNRDIKWHRLLEFADRLNADYVATGHYASVLQLPNGRYTVRQAAHHAKDQTYMLCRLTQEQLRRTFMPLGNLTKQEVRQIAEQAGLPVAHKKDSQEICFVTDGHYADFIEEHAERELPPYGDFVNSSGETVGQHHGIYRYTVGQRKGLGVALGMPAYVQKICEDTNQILLGSEAELYQNSVICNDVSFMGIDGLRCGETLRADVKIRYHHAPQAATVTILPDGTMQIQFEQPVRAPAPGQTAVLYDSNACVIGCGIIVCAE